MAAQQTWTIFFPGLDLTQEYGLDPAQTRMVIGPAQWPWGKISWPLHIECSDWGGLREKKGGWLAWPGEKKGWRRSMCCRKDWWVVGGGNGDWDAVEETTKVMVERGWKEKLARNSFFLILHTDFSSPRYEIHPYL